MQQHTFEQLAQMTVAQLREVANGIEHEAVKGFSTMHKEQLLPALCAALGIEAHAHHIAALAEKGQLRAQIREMKGKRQAAVAAHDRRQLAAVRDRIHHLKRELRKAAR